MKKKPRAPAAVMIFVLMSVLLSACAPGRADNISPPVETESGTPVVEQVDTGKRYSDEIFSLNCDVDAGFNPYETSSSGNMELAPLMYEGLFAVNGDFSYSKVLCEECSTSDGRVYKLDIKKGIVLHDGSELTPEDVAYSIELARVSGNFASRLSIITAAYIIEGSVYVELSRVNHNFPMLLDIPVVKAGSGEETVPVGSGPYFYVDAGEYLYLKAFDRHRSYSELPSERIYLKEYRGGELITAFDSGLIDLVTTSKADINYLEYSGNTESRLKDTNILYFLGINSRNKFLSDKNRRVLFSSMVDRYMLSNEVIEAVPVTIPLHPSAYFYSEDYDSFTIRNEDIEAAKIEFLVEDYDADGMLEYMDLENNSVEEITLRLAVNKENPTKVEAARKLSESLGKMGIDVVVTEHSWSSYIRALKNGDYDIYYGEVMLTADFDLTQLLSYGGSANYSVYDAELQSLIYDFNSSEEDSKDDAAAKLYGYIAQNLPVISLMFEIETVYTHRETVSAIEPTVHNVFNNMTEWVIDVE